VLLEALPHTTPGVIETMALASVQAGLGVRHLKMQVERMINPELNQPEPRTEKPVDPNVRAAQLELERLLGTRVRITDWNGKGKIVIEYRNLSDFDRVLELLRSE
jgi:ParB family transcriptional regulator, chromosome partitioning protein